MVDDVFRALADHNRRELLDELAEHGGRTLRELAAGRAMSRQAVAKHLGVLEAAGVVTAVRRGREKLHYLNAAPIGDIADRWIARYHRHRSEALSDLRRALEDDVDAPAFSYTTYIRTTPERCWQALTDPAFTRRYWQGVEFETDWHKGSPMVLRNRPAGLVIKDDAQVVLEADPPHRLSYTWHTFTEAWARAYGLSDEYLRRVRDEARSKVTFEIEDVGDGRVRLSVLHDGFGPDSAVLEGVSQGWPALLSSLKTLLETGEPLPGG